ncbi:hypothetical protein [Crocosphaera subtropica]|nr:hypothetical protein [Crocosphaera subtropica]
MITISFRLPKQAGIRNRALVLRKLTNDPNANYSTCHEDLDSSLNDCYSQGHYFQTYDEALSDFQERCQKEFDFCQQIMFAYWQSK